MFPRPIPPPLYIPNSANSSLDANAGPAFGIPSYSHRKLPRPKVVRPRLTAGTFTVNDRENPTSDLSSSSDNDTSSITSRRSITFNNRPFSSGIRPPTPPPKAHPTDRVPRPASTYSFGSSFHGSSFEVRDPSPVETFLSTSYEARHTRVSSFAATDGHPSRPASRSLPSQASCKVWRWKPRGGSKSTVTELPIYLSSLAMADSEKGDEPRTALGEGPGGRKETEGDKLRRMFLCPWEAVSPRTYRAAQKAGSRDAEKFPSNFGWASKETLTNSGSSPLAAATHARKRILISVGVTLLAILLVVDLLLLNIKLLPPAFNHSSSSHRNTDTCLSLFSVSAPLDPLSFPCTTCTPLVAALSSLSKSRPLDQTQVLQFCALRDLYVEVEPTLISGNSTGIGGTLIGEGWMASTDYCDYVGVVCDREGRVESLTLAEFKSQMSLPASIKYLEATLKTLVLGGNEIAL